MDLDVLLSYPLSKNLNFFYKIYIFDWIICIMKRKPAIMGLKI